MAQVLRRFFNRAPRYVLRPDDNRMLRFAPNSVLNRSYSTRYVNVSETGLAFTIDRSSAPTIGEFIKIEFPLPGGEQIAWFAKVVRLEQHQPAHWWGEHEPTDQAREVLVGVQFHQLPEGHRHAIRLHLHTKFHQVLREQRLAGLRRLSTFLKEHGWQLLLYALSAIATVAVLYFLTRPSANYDAFRGAPWGQRFKFGD